MTEAEWRDCEESTLMLDSLRGKVSDRKLLLFTAATIRQRIPVAHADDDTAAVIERYADGHALSDQADEASENVWGDAMAHAIRVSGWCRQYPQIGTGARLDTSEAQAARLRCVAGPLAFRPITIDANWLTWNHATVPAIARRIYDERTFHDLPILADALEEAGCTGFDLLDHCRQGGEHVRGCWVVDLILGKA